MERLASSSRVGEGRGEWGIGQKGPRRKEALARFEVAATQKKAKLIGGRTQVRGGLLDCLGEIKILLALETIARRR
jgi:hypothetical protein